MIKKYVHKDGKEYFRVEARVKAHGRVAVRRLSKIEDFSKAQIIETKLRNEAERALMEMAEDKKSWASIVESWKASYEDDPFFRTLSPEAFSDYRNAVESHTKGWRRLSIDEIRPRDAFSLLDRLETTLSQGRVKRVKVAISSVFRWASYAGLTTAANPTVGYRSRHRAEEKMPEILSRGEIKLLLKRAEDLKHPWFPIWSLALYTGMRSGELKALRWRNVDLDKRLIFVYENWTSKRGVHATKGRYWRIVSFDSDELYFFLRELKARAISEYVLPQFKEWEQGLQAVVLRDFCKAIGITPVKFHTLRACFATTLLSDGVDPATIMKVCGWKDLKTMGRYIRLAAIDITGATKSLDFLPEKRVVGKVISLFREDKPQG